MTLFRAEWSRMATYALLLALAHLAGLIFLSRMVDLGQQNLAVHWSFGAVYALVGGLLGFAQFAAYARPNPWLSLIHRPRSPAAIAVALLGTGWLVMVLAIAIPIASTALWQETLTARVVDTRHWLLALAAWQIAACAYCCGVFAALAPRRFAAIGAVLLFWLINARATGWSMLAVQLLALAWSIWMVAALFKANREEPRKAAVAAIAIPLAMASYFLALMLFAAIELIWIAWGTHPNNSVPPLGGHNEVEKATAQERMLAALAPSEHADAALLAEQVKLAEPISIGSSLSRLPQWFELANVAPMEFDDDRLGIRYVFSHDDTRLHGYRVRDGSAAATLPFEFQHPPLPFGRLPGMRDGDAVLVARGRVYHYESEAQQVELRVDLGDEALVSMAPVGEAYAALSDQALYIFDARPFIAERGVVAPRARWPLPGAYGDLSNLDLIELVDGHLLVATFGHLAHDAVGTPPFQTAQVLRSDGSVDDIGRRALSHDFGWLYRYQAVWLSPGLYTLRERAKWLFASPSLERTEPAPVPRAVWALAMVLGLLAVLVTLWRLHGLRRWPWMVASGLFGLPMLAALLLIELDRETRR